MQHPFVGSRTPGYLRSHWIFVALIILALENGGIFMGRGNAQLTYPPRLVSAILAAVRQELIDNNSMHWLDAGQHIDEPDEWQTHPGYYSEIYDAITGVHLDADLVSAGRTEEMTFLKQLGAYEYDSITKCKAATGKPPVRVG